MDEDKLKKLEAVLQLVTESITKKEFVQAFDVVIKMVRDLEVSNKAEFALIQENVSRLADQLRTTAEEDLAELKTGVSEDLQGEVAALIESQISVLDAALHSVEEKLATVKDGATPSEDELRSLIEPLIPEAVPGDDGSPDTGDEIIAKINQADQLIAKSAIEGMDALEKAVKEKTGNTTRIGWGAHPLTVQGLGVTIDKNTRVINFKGAGVSSVTRRKDGVVEVTISGGSGVAGTLVSEEIPTDSGDHINFTLAHSPDAGTLRVYRGGARQASIGTTPDFTHTGTALVLSSALDTANGEVLFADYSYT